MGLHGSGGTEGTCDSEGISWAEEPHSSCRCKR